MEVNIPNTKEVLDGEGQHDRNRRDLFCFEIAHFLFPLWASLADLFLGHIHGTHIVLSICVK